MYTLPFDVPESTYDSALDVLHSALRFGISPMLESVEDMLAELGNPDHAFRKLQIAGTNGKTSTARYTAAILRAAGMRVALYTSPELVRYTERMEVDGRPVSDAAFARGISAARLAGERVNARRKAAGERPYDITEFDLLTVAAAVVFAEAQVDVAVLECGMGGRWDATSAMAPIESVCVTGIGLDHMHVLGDTLEAIAGEKAAIIKPGRTCVLGVGTATPASVEDVFLDQCKASGVTPTLLRPEVLSDAAGEMQPGVPREHPELPHASYRITQLPDRIGGSLLVDVTTPNATYRELGALKPGYQAANIACAVALAEQFLGRALDPDKLADAIVTCPTPGRFDVVRPEPLGLIDACHNPQSVETFLSAVRSVEPDVSRRPQLLCAVLADKDVEGIVRLLAPEFPSVSVTRTDSARALPAEELGKLFERAGKAPKKVYPDVPTAIADLSDQEFVACGSITLAGAVAGILRP
ncbi:MAG: bifunctional folylpolyglutamate synthase/dihydrofolate synthase [Tractidigestivibacter sp.]|jgi:dihydrofolate synthase/folylpolyglutamate synthase|uniref:bifunctional folylpolyglutamate synthase/dihydrofolate synthase n=1 Tax=Tractidigestivibacter sp. TaxID=2847320 RepID=UPI003D8B6A2E